MVDIIHFGDLRLAPGVNRYEGDLYVIGNLYDEDYDNIGIDSTLVVEGNLYVSGTAFLHELKISGSIYANRISCSNCIAGENIYVETELDGLNVIAGESIYVQEQLLLDDTVACFESIYAKFINSPLIRSTFIECGDLVFENIIGDTLTVNGELIIDNTPESPVNIELNKICSTNINIG